MLFSGNVNELEVKEKNSGDPAVDDGVGLDVGVVEHAAYKDRVHFDDEVGDADDVKPEGAKSSEKTVELDLWLRVVRFALVPRYRAKAGRASSSISTLLRQDPANSAPRRIHSQDNGSISRIVDRDEG